MTEDRAVLPLVGWGLLLYPYKRVFTRDKAARDLLDRRAEAGRKYLEDKRAERALKRALSREAKLFGELMRDAFARMGEAHVPRHDYESSEGGRVRRNRRVKVNKVQFDVCFTSAEVLNYKIKVSRRSMLRPWVMKNALPHRVFVGNLTRPEAIQELEYVLERKVGVVNEDPTRGAWIQVFRLEGLGGLPKRVAYADVISKYPADMSKGPLLIGVGGHRSIEIVEIASHPHALIAGSSGSGKSNMVNQLICSMLRFADPADLKFILIDLKRLEFSYYKKCGHLQREIVVEPEDAITALQFLLKEIKERTQKLDERAKSVEEFNELYPAEKLPRIICVIDEFAELMMGSEKSIAQEADRQVKRIANLGRAVGVHLWICTQRPVSQVVNNAIKINMPLVIAGRTQNTAQSAVILGNGEAARLPNLPGRMIYQSGSEQTIIQAPFISTPEILELIRISAGRAAGLLSIDGIEPVLNKDRLVAALALSGAPVDSNTRESQGVTHAMYRQFLAWLVETRRFPVGAESYVFDGERLVKAESPVAGPVLSLLPSPVPAVAVESSPEPVDDPARRGAAALEALRAIRASKAKESGVA